MVLTNVETSIRSARIPQTNRYRNEKDSIWSPLPHQVISSGFIVKPQTYRYRNETVSDHLYHIRLYLVHLTMSKNHTHKECILYLTPWDALTQLRRVWALGTFTQRLNWYACNICTCICSCNYKLAPILRTYNVHVSLILIFFLKNLIKGPTI